jgi:hypothetical protein
MRRTGIGLLFVVLAQCSDGDDPPSGAPVLTRIDNASQLIAGVARTRHARAEADRVGCRGDTAHHTPSERRLALAIDPRVVVVGKRHEREPELLRLLGIADEVGRTVFFARERVAKGRHARRVPGARHLPHLMD